MRSDRSHSAAVEVKLERGNDWGVILGWCQESDRQDGAVTELIWNRLTGKRPTADVALEQAKAGEQAGIDTIRCGDVR
jgi:hypothetical protein